MATTIKSMIYEIFTQGRKVGISVADNPNQALAQAKKAFTRSTVSKEEASCDYEDLIAKPMNLPVVETAAMKALQRITAAATQAA